MTGKVLFVTFEFGGLPLGFLDTVIRTFERTGLEFKTADFSRELEYCVADYQPSTFIFFHPWLKDFQSKADVIEKLPGHKILWTMEDPYEIDLVEQYHHYFGYILTTDRASAEYLRQTTGKGTHLPHGAIPEVHKPQEVSWEYRSDLCFIGNAFPSRLQFFRKVLPSLKDYNVILGGTGWNLLNDSYGQRIINHGVSSENYLKFINGAKVNINLHRLRDDVSIANKNGIMPSSPNNRFFEICACKAVQMVDSSRSPELLDYYGTDEVIMFYDENDFLMLFEKLMANKNYRNEVAEKAYQRTLKDHIYERRFVQVLGDLIK